MFWSGFAALMVLKDVVVLMDEGPVVFVVHGNEVWIRFIEVGPEVGGWIFVRKGLSSGESVATAGSFALKVQLFKAKLGED